jgi:hypothetical protein
VKGGVAPLCFPPSGGADRSLHCKIRSLVCVQSNREVSNSPHFHHPHLYVLGLRKVNSFVVNSFFISSFSSKHPE